MALKKKKRKVLNKKQYKVRKRGKRKVVKKVKVETVALQKPEENIILAPNPENEWEAWQTFNPGVILLENKVHIIYRAIGKDGISRLGYAISEDGFTITERLSYPIYEHKKISSDSQSYLCYLPYTYGSGFGLGGAEDPRIVRVGEEDTLYMTYTALDGGIRIGLTSIKVEDFLNKNWKWKEPTLISPPGEIHKNWVIFPEKIKGKYAILHSISPKILIEYRETLEFKPGEYIQSFYSGYISDPEDRWEGWVRGAGAPPLKTKLGWLLFYHAQEKGDFGKYKVGVMLLEKENPENIIFISRNPILEPDEDYQTNGFKPGVVYASGAIIKDGKILVYYGSADSFISVSFADLEEFLSALMRQAKPTMQFKKVKVKKGIK